MKKEIKDLIQELKPGKYSSYKGLGIIPLFPKIDETVEYFSLRRALEDGLLEITEVSEGGTVPNLKVNNIGGKPVLAVDGEEIKGAKQNRILNTSILIKEKKEQVIPVSCTESGRWAYQGKKFHDSDVIMAREARAYKEKTVTANLMMYDVPKSNQSGVWNEIDSLSKRRGVRSKTSAMRDVFSDSKVDLQKYVDNTKVMKDQKGVICIINGDISGIDLVSRSDVYAQLHDKFIRSYAIEVPLKEKHNDDFNESKIEEFIKRILKTEEKYYDSVGYGKDHRYKGTNVIGSSLIYKKIPIHTTFFNMKKKDSKKDHYADIKRRRDHIYNIDENLRR